MSYICTDITYVTYHYKMLERPAIIIVGMPHPYYVEDVFLVKKKDWCIYTLKDGNRYIFELRRSTSWCTTHCGRHIIVKEPHRKTLELLKTRHLAVYGRRETKRGSRKDPDSSEFIF